MNKNHIFYLFIISSFLLVSCHKDSGSGSNVPYYFTAQINGANIKYDAPDATGFTGYGCGYDQPENSLGFTDFDIYEGTVIENQADLLKSNIRVHILKYFDHDPSLTERSDMIHLGSYGYGVSNVSSSTVNGASIIYVDANGDGWFSETGPQTGSTFSITELITNTEGTSGKIFKATFNCKLYDQNGVTSINVTNATIRGKILSP